MVEATATGFSVHSPDLPGCVATDASQAAVESTMREAIELHLQGHRADGLPVPAPHSYVTTIEVAA